MEATLAQEREKLKAEEERLKKELELKYRGEAELKIRAQEERIQVRAKFLQSHTCMCFFLTRILGGDELGAAA